MHYHTHHAFIYREAEKFCLDPRWEASFLQKSQVPPLGRHEPKLGTSWRRDQPVSLRHEIKQRARVPKLGGNSTSKYSTPPSRSKAGRRRGPGSAARPPSGNPTKGDLRTYSRSPLVDRSASRLREIDPRRTSRVLFESMDDKHPNGSATKACLRPLAKWPLTVAKLKEVHGRNNIQSQI